LGATGIAATETAAVVVAPVGTAALVATGLAARSVEFMAAFGDVAAAVGIGATTTFGIALAIACGVSRAVPLVAAFAVALAVADALALALAATLAVVLGVADTATDGASFGAVSDGSVSTVMATITMPAEAIVVSIRVRACHA